jgi:tetratricopeptide (TPR) repeat protein
LYHSVLAGKRALLLLDNAASGEQVETLLPPAGCAVLITSRIRFALPGLAEKDLDVLPKDKACELLLEIAPRIGDRAEELAKICGYLPFALRNAAGALAEKKDLSVPEYQIRLKDKVALLKLVKGSFSLSYDLLTSGRKKQWRRLSVFPEDFDRKAATAVLKMAQDASADALSDLVRWSLVDFAAIPDSEDGRYRLHDLARLFAESCLDQEELADAQQKHATYYSKVLSHAENFYQKGGTDLLAGLELFDREWANIKIGQAWAKNIIQISSKLNKSDLKSVLQLARSYANDGGNVLNLRLHPLEKISLLETGLKAAKMLRDRNAESVNLGNLGMTYINLGETRKAIGYLERALNISREIGDRKNDGAYLSNLGGAYVGLGETRKAIEYYEQALIIFRKIEDRKGEGVGLGSLGLAYAALGETRKAIEYHEKALAISRGIGDRKNEGAYLGNLGLAYAGLGETRKAIEYNDKALAISREIGDRRGEGAELGNLGLAYAGLGETRKAIEYHDQALAISREIGDKNNDGVHLSNLGLAYADLGDTNKAIEYHEQALAIAREIGDKRNEGEILCNLGKAYLDLNETERAFEYCMQSLAIVRKIEYRKIEGEALCTLGKAYSDLGEIDKAIDHCDQALKIFKKMEYRQGEGEALFNKSQAMQMLDRRTEAAALANEALQIFSQIENHQAEKVRQKLAEWAVGN